MRYLATLLLLVAAGTSSAQSSTSGPPRTPLLGDWQLNLARTRYGASVDKRRRERFTCTAEGDRVACIIRSVRADGRELVGRFSARLDGVGAAVSGIPDVDEVRLQPGSSYLDATFLSRGKPVFGYRAFQSRDGKSLMIVAVDPISRATLSTVVVYDRRTKR